VPYSKITKKGQMTIPIDYRRKHNLHEGTLVTIEETDKGLIIKPIPDIAESAGALSKYAELEDVLAALMRGRKEAFR